MKRILPILLLFFSYSLKAQVCNDGLLRIDLTGVKNGHIFYFDTNDSIARTRSESIDSVKVLEFTWGDTFTPSDSVLVHSKFINKRLKVWKNGLFQHKSTNTGIEFDNTTGTVILHPQPQQGDKLYFEATNIRTENISLESPPLTLLEEKIFTASGSWTLAASGTSVAEISTSDEAIEKVHLTRGTSFAVCYKNNIFVVGDIIKVTLSGVTVSSGTPKIAVGHPSTPEYSATVTSGSCEFIVNTSGYGGAYIIIGGLMNPGAEVYVRSIKIEKY